MPAEMRWGPSPLPGVRRQVLGISSNAKEVNRKKRLWERSIPADDERQSRPARASLELVRNWISASVAGLCLGNYCKSSVR